MATSTTTPRAGLPQWKAEDKVKFITDVSKAFEDVDKSFALSGDALIPCTATYDSATKRHTLTPAQANITLPEVFTVQFIATASFTTGDKIYIGGKEYTPAYTDGAQVVQTGVWVLDAAVGITCVKTIAKAFVGAGFTAQFTTLNATKAPLASPAFTGTAKLNNKEIPTMESGTWTPMLRANGANPTYEILYNISVWQKVGNIVFISCRLQTKITNAGSGTIYISGLPFPVQSNGFGMDVFLNYNIFRHSGTETVPMNVKISANAESNNTVVLNNEWGANGIYWFVTQHGHLNFSGWYFTN